VGNSSAYYAYRDTDRDLSVALGHRGTTLGVEGAISKARETLYLLLDKTSEKCSSCETGTAWFLWVPGSAFDNDWARFSVVDIAKRNFEAASFCGACAVRSIKDAVESERIDLFLAYPPIDGTILMFSGEA
jgi:hypothetical protein